MEILQLKNEMIEIKIFTVQFQLRMTEKNSRTKQRTVELINLNKERKKLEKYKQGLRDCEIIPKVLAFMPSESQKKTTVKE